MIYTKAKNKYIFQNHNKRKNPTTCMRNDWFILETTIFLLLVLVFYLVLLRVTKMKMSLISSSINE